MAGVGGVRGLTGDPVESLDTLLAVDATGVVHAVLAYAAALEVAVYIHARVVGSNCLVIVTLGCVPVTVTSCVYVESECYCLYGFINS